MVAVNNPKSNAHKHKPAHHTDKNTQKPRKTHLILQPLHQHLHNLLLGRRRAHNLQLRRVAHRRVHRRRRNCGYNMVRLGRAMYEHRRTCIRRAGVRGRRGRPDRRRRPSGHPAKPVFAQCVCWMLASLLLAATLMPGLKWVGVP